jgi:hypothetical protein
MGDISKNISRDEMRCQCEYSDCKRTPIDAELVEVLQELCNHFTYLEKNRSMTFKRVALHFNSGYRCTQHNEDSGSESDIHTLGMAADIWMEYLYHNAIRQRVDDVEIQDYLEHRYPTSLGIGRYPRPGYPKTSTDTDMPRTHVDVRNDESARWIA